MGLLAPGLRDLPIVPQEAGRVAGNYDDGMLKTQASWAWSRAEDNADALSAPFSRCQRLARDGLHQRTERRQHLL